METNWIFLVLISAVIHPFRDLTLKRVAHPISCYVGVCLSWAIISTGHVVITRQNLILPYQIWPLVGLSAIGLTIYYFGTLAALRRGNLSVYYPIVRSAPVAIVLFSFLALGQNYLWVTLAGIGLVMIGGLMIQKTPGSLLNDPRAFGLAVLAMLGSTAYSISDATAMQQVGAAPFLFWVYILVTAMLGAICAWEIRAIASPLSGVFLGWIAAPGKILFAGVSSYLSYLLILKAFSIGADTASVSAVRQASIPVSVALAAILLQEPQFLKRIKWASLIALGIAFIALG